MEWLRLSSARSNVITSASGRDRMPRPCCVSCRRESHTTTRFTRTKLSVIVHPVSSSQLTKDLDRVRSFRGYNIGRGRKKRASLLLTLSAGSLLLPPLACLRRVAHCETTLLVVQDLTSGEDHRHMSLLNGNFSATALAFRRVLLVSPVVSIALGKEPCPRFFESPRQRLRGVMAPSPSIS